MGVKYGDKAEGQAAKASSNKPSGGGASFMKRGNAARKAMEEDEARAEARRAEAGKMWRFYIGKDDLEEDFKITFLDGDLDKDGMLELNSWDEHTVMNEGRPEQYICTGENEPCPLCHDGNKPSFVAAFTIIDHQEYTIKKGTRQGQTVKDERKLYIAKRQTIGKLQKIAAKAEGLRGVQVTVSRSTKDAAQVGDMFILDEKFDDDELMEKYGKGDEKNIAPANYEEEIVYRDAATLTKMGVAAAISGVSSKGSKPSKEYADDM